MLQMKDEQLVVVIPMKQPIAILEEGKKDGPLSKYICKVLWGTRTYSSKSYPKS